jgi:hypothetical protein
MFFYFNTLTTNFNGEGETLSLQIREDRCLSLCPFTVLLRVRAKTQHNVSWTPLCTHTHTHTINVNKTCALQQTTGKTGTKHSLCEIDKIDMHNRSERLKTGKQRHSHQ